MNSTVNEPGCSSQLNSTEGKVGQTFAYCLILVLSLVGNSSIGIIVYRTQTMRKPINYFVTNMAMSDLLYSIFFFPHKIALLYKGQHGLLAVALVKQCVNCFLSCPTGPPLFPFRV